MTEKRDLAHNPDVVAFFASFDTGSYLTILVFLAASNIVSRQGFGYVFEVES